MKFSWSFGASAAFVLLAIVLALFALTVQPVHADTGVSVFQTVHTDLPGNVGAQVAALRTSSMFSRTSLRTPCAAPAPYVNPFSLTVAIGGTVQGYQADWTNVCPTIEVCPTYNNFLGLPINVTGSVRYCNFTGQGGGSDYWKDKSQWTIGAEAPLGGGAVLFTRYENHFLVNDDWFFGGIRLTLQ